MTWLEKQPGNILDSDTYNDLTYLNTAVHTNLLRAYRNVLSDFFEKRPRSKKQAPNTGGKVEEMKVKAGSLAGWYLLRSIIRLESADDQKRALEQMRGWDRVKATGGSTGWTKEILAPFLIEVLPNVAKPNNNDSIKIEITRKGESNILIWYDYHPDRNAFLLRQSVESSNKNLLTDLEIHNYAKLYSNINLKFPYL